MGTHLIDGSFQSDKYPTTPRGKVPLSIDDATAQDLLWTYAQRRRSVDVEFSDDLETALRTAGYVPPVATNGAPHDESTAIAAAPAWADALANVIESYLKKSSDKAQVRHVLSGYRAEQEFKANRGVTVQITAYPEVIAYAPNKVPESPAQTAAKALDEVYGERNQLVAAVARFALNKPGAFWFAGLGKHQPEGDPNWDPEWTNVVFVDSPGGQLSWHVHDRDLPLFDGLPAYLTAWDGHTTEEKYARLAKVVKTMAAARPADEISALAKDMIQDGGNAGSVAMSFLCEALVRLRMQEPRPLVETKVALMLDGIEQASREHVERYEKKISP